LHMVAKGADFSKTDVFSAASREAR
jgi:hypothetical protein